jgi:hypothetical protein
MWVRLPVLEVDERPGDEHALDGAQPLRGLRPVAVVAADHLGEQVERPSADHHVARLHRPDDPAWPRPPDAVRGDPWCMAIAATDSLVTPVASCQDQALCA